MSVVTVPHWSRLRHLAPEDRAAYVARLIDSEAWRVDPIFARAVVARDAQLTALGTERTTFRPPWLCRVGFVAFPLDTPDVFDTVTGKLLRFYDRVS